ncbi:MAG TPA: energy transducer TonB [Cyclobacteriaceae bacterium]|nr:energy transducer TonB [Cyclobacteriaceae bacterium]
MKTYFNILIFALALVLMQACGSKSKENKEGLEATETKLSAEDKAALEKREAVQKREAAQKERLRAAAERRAAAEKSYKDANGDIIYNKAEIAPSFTGGQKAMTKYFNDNLKYPKAAETKGWEGTIYVDFVVGKDGNVRGATVTDETDADADQSLKDEAIRVVTNMPKWIPGRQIGKAVRVKYNLPVAFKIV